MIDLSGSSFLIQSFVLAEILIGIMDPSMGTNSFSLSESAVRSRKLYMSCGDDSNCVAVSMDPKCIVHKTCMYLLDYVNDPVDAAIEFNVIVDDFPPGVDQYVAVGFGEYDRMYNNSVVACIRYKGRLNIHLSLNDDTRQNNEKVSQEPLTPMNIQTDDVEKKLFCSFKLEMIFSLKGVQFNLNSIPYYVLFARGPSRSLRKLGYHKPWGSMVSPTGINLLTDTDQNVFKPDSKNLNSLRVHTCFFNFVFVFLIPTSGMFARFFKESYIDRRIFNKRIWFTLHWLTSLASVLLIAGAYLAVSDKSGTRIHSAKAELHSRLGSILALLTFVVATIGLMIGCVSPLSCLRRLFSKMHCFLGCAIYLMGMIQIFLSVWTKPFYLNYCSTSEAVVLAWLFFHFLMYAFLTGILYRRDGIDARIQQLETLQGMIALAKNYSMRKYLNTDFTIAEKGLNRRVSGSGTGPLPSLPRVSSTDIEKTEEDIERAAKIIEQINYNKRIIEKLYILNGAVNAKKKNKGKKHNMRAMGQITATENTKIYSGKQNPRNRNKRILKFKAAVGNTPVKNPQGPFRNTVADSKNQHADAKNNPNANPDGATNGKVTDQKDVKVLSPAIKGPPQAKIISGRNAKHPIPVKKPINHPIPAPGQYKRRNTLKLHETPHPHDPPPSSEPDGKDAPNQTNPSDGSDSSEESEPEPVQPLSEEHHAADEQQARRHSSFGNRRKSSVNPEDPEDFLNYFHTTRRPLDPYRAFVQYPLQPQLIEYAHTRLVTVSLVLFTLVSFSTALTLSLLMYADQTYPGCSVENNLLILQQWW